MTKWLNNPRRLEITFKIILRPCDDFLEEGFVGIPPQGGGVIAVGKAISNSLINFIHTNRGVYVHSCEIDSLEAEECQ
jgi:hypothetical protein